MATFGKTGLNIQQWAKWRRELLTTGTYDPNEWYKLDSYQKDWTNDTLNTLDDLSVRNDVKL